MSQQDDQQPGSPSTPPPAPTPTHVAPVRATDPVSIAALVAGVLGTGPIALILGVLGIRRIGEHRGGRGLAIAGVVLGALTTVGWIWFIISLVNAATTENPWDTATDQVLSATQIAEATDECSDGDITACDRLYDMAERDSASWAVAASCGGYFDRSDDQTCMQVYQELAAEHADDDETTDTPESDPAPSTATAAELAEQLGQDAEVIATQQTLVDMMASPSQSNDLGDNSMLDIYYTSCQSGDDVACGQLFLLSREGSQYQAFAETCGGRGAQPGVCAP